MDKREWDAGMDRGSERIGIAEPLTYVALFRSLVGSMAGDKLNWY